MTTNAQHNVQTPKHTSLVADPSFALPGSRQGTASELNPLSREYAERKLPARKQSHTQKKSPSNK